MIALKQAAAVSIWLLCRFLFFLVTARLDSGSASPCASCSDADRMNRYFTRDTFVALLFIAAVIHLCCALIAPFSGQVHHYLHWFCHQQPERSFNLFGHRCGVCARCTGVYLGIIAGFFLLRRKTRFSRCTLLLSALIAAASMILRLVAFELPNLTRSFTGICLGISMIAAVSVLAAYFVQVFTASLLFIERMLNSRIRERGTSW